MIPFWNKKRPCSCLHPEQENHSDRKVDEILSQLACEAEKHGAKRMTISAGCKATYEFSVGSATYAGKIDQSIIKSINVICNKKNTLTIQPDSTSTMVITIEAIHNCPLIFELRWSRDTAAPAITPQQLTTDQLQRSANLIAIIDDDNRFATLLQHILKSQGYKTLHYLNAEDGLLARRNNLLTSEALIICDVNLPRKSGLEFIRELRNRDYNNSVIMLTADDNELIEAELALLGIDVFVRKKSDPKILLAWIKNIFARKVLINNELTNDQLLCVANGNN